MSTSDGSIEGLPSRNDNTYSSNQIHGHARVHQGDSINITHNYIHQQTNEADECDKAKRKAFLDSLTFDRMGARLRNVESALPQTCRWLFHHTQVREWTNDDNAVNHHGFLWIKGKPGSGKSTIMKAALRWAKKNWSEQVIISYFFNGRAPGQLEKSSLGLYRSLVHQLLTALPVLQPIFLNKFEDKEKDGLVEDWSAIELQEFLIDVVTHPNLARINIFIDALDEGQEDDIRNMVAFFDDLGYHSVTNDTRLRICLSSRHYPHITCRKGLSLVVEDQQEHDQDIKRYVRNKLHGDDDSIPLNHLRQSICRKSEGVFLWVVLVIPILNGTYDRGESQAAEEYLSRIPAKLDTLFEEILVKNTEQLEQCVCLLQWTLFSFSPLTPVEMYMAVHYSHTPNQKIDVQVPSEKMCSRYLLHHSRGLVEQTASSPPTMQFIHETVRQYLLSETGLAKLQPSLSANIVGQSHDLLRRGCFEYVSQNWSKRFEEGGKGGFKRMSSAELTKMLALWTTRLPFLKYAVNTIFSHSDAAQKCGISQHEFLVMIQSDQNAYFAKWINIWNCFRRRSKFIYAWHTSPLYIFSEQNLPNLVQSLIDDGADVNARGNLYGTALQAACAAGNEKVVDCLIAAGADINAKSGKYHHAYLAAIHFNHIRLARSLLSKGASPDTDDLNQMFMIFIRTQSFERCELLLQSGANINLEDSSMGTPLIHAAKTRKPKLLQWLLARRADAGQQMRGHEPVLATYINESARHVLRYHRNSQGELMRSGTIRETEIEKIVNLLIDSGANVDAQGTHLRTALFVSCEQDLPRVTQCLLDHGANVGQVCLKYCPQFLFEYGIQPVDGVYKKLPKTLHIAVISGNAKMVRLLIENGANVDGRCAFSDTPYIDITMGATPLQVSAYWGHTKVAEVLIRHGANVNEEIKCRALAWGAFEGTALHIACMFDYDDVVKVLLEKGADINARVKYRYRHRNWNNDSDSAWAIASVFGNKKIKQILEQNGAVPCDTAHMKRMLGYWWFKNHYGYD